MQFALNRGFALGKDRLQQALQYYQETFGFVLAEENAKYLELFLGPLRLTLCKAEPLEIQNSPSIPTSEALLTPLSALTETSDGRWMRDPFGFLFCLRLVSEKNSASGVTFSAAPLSSKAGQTVR